MLLLLTALMIGISLLRLLNTTSTSQEGQKVLPFTTVTTDPSEGVARPLLNTVSTFRQRRDTKSDKILTYDQSITTNTYLSLTKMVADHSPNSTNCYVCGFIPHSTNEGLPLMALPISDCDTCHLLHLNTFTSYTHELCPVVPMMRPLPCKTSSSSCQTCTDVPTAIPFSIIPQPFKWCIRGIGVGRNLGISNCETVYSPIPRQFFQIQVSDDHIQPEACAKSYRHFDRLATAASACSVPSGKGMYWICGLTAYDYLPKDGVPAMRVVNNMPSIPSGLNSHRSKRDILYTHSQTYWSRLLGMLIPSYGVLSSMNQIRDLSKHYFLRHIYAINKIGCHPFDCLTKSSSFRLSLSISGWHLCSDWY